MFNFGDQYDIDTLNIRYIIEPSVIIMDFNAANISGKEIITCSMGNRENNYEPIIEKTKDFNMIISNYIIEIKE